VKPDEANGKRSSRKSRSSVVAPHSRACFKARSKVFRVEESLAKLPHKPVMETGEVVIERI
jgi:hypothetical protein